MQRTQTNGHQDTNKYRKEQTLFQIIFPQFFWVAMMKDTLYKCSLPILLLSHFKPAFTADLGQEVCLTGVSVNLPRVFHFVFVLLF